MTSIFDKLDIAPNTGVALAPDPRVDPRIISTLRGRNLRQRSVFHRMEIDLEADADRPLIPGIRPTSRRRDDSALDALRPSIRDAIADIMATDPALRTRLERGEAVAQAQIADPVIRRLVSQRQRFEAPDFITVFEEEVEKQVVEPTVGEKIADIGTTLIRVGLSMAATTESGVASVAEAVSKIPFLPHAKLYKFLSEGGDLFSRDMMRIIQRHAQGDPRLEEDFLWRTLPESVGSFGGFILITAGATALGGPGAGVATAASMATTMGVGESRQRRQLAIQSGALNPNEGQLAELNGALPGIIQVLPVFRALRLMGPKASLVLRRGIRQYATDGIETALEEALVETLGELGQDAIEKWNFNPDKVIGETAIETAKASGAGGFVVGLATSAIRGVRLGRYRKPPDGGNGFKTEDARRIMADALALEESARQHIDEAATDDRPAQRQALDLLRVNVTNLEFVKQGRQKIVADLMERFGLSKRKASRMYIRVKAAYEMVKLAESAAQPAGVLRQAQVMVNEALTEPTDPATPQTVDQSIPPERNTFAQSVRQDLYREFRNELTELDIVEEPLGATLPRGVPARFLVGEGGETLPIPLSPFPVTDPAEIRQLGLQEHRESIAFRDFRLMDLFEANTLAELLQEANPDVAVAVFRAGEGDWRVFFKQAEVATLFEQEPDRGQEGEQAGPEAPGGPEGPSPAPGAAPGPPPAPPGGPGVAGGAVAGPVGAAAQGVAGRVQDAAAVAGGRREAPGPGQEPAGRRRRERIAPPPVAPAVANVAVKFANIRALVEDAGREFPSAIDTVEQRLQTVDVSGEPSAIDFFALHPDALDGLSAVDKLRVRNQFPITEDADAIADVVGAALYEQAVQEALTAGSVRDNLHRIADIVLSNPQSQDQNQVLAALIFRDRAAVDTVQRQLGRDHYRSDQIPVGATFELFGVPFEIAEHDGIRALLHTESGIAIVLKDVSILIPIDRGTLEITRAARTVEGGQPGLLGEQFAGAITGRQTELPLPIPSPVELEVEADAERARRRLEADESGNLFPQDVANPVPFDDALETAPDGLEFTGTAMPEGDIRADLLQKFQEEPAEALLFAEAMGIKNADQKSSAEIIDEFWATKEETLKDDDGPADVIPQMLYSGIPIPDYLPAMVVKGTGEFAKPVISIAFVDLVDRLRRVSDDPLIQQAAEAARLATLDAKGFIGELSALLDPVLRMTGKHALTEEGKATQRIQQIQWDDNGEGGVSLFHLALEDKLPPGVTLSETEQKIIELGKQVIALGGQLHEREGTMRFNHRTQEWEPFQQIGRAVAPRISTLELLDLVAQGEGERFGLLVRLIAENPDNRALLLQRIESKAGATRDDAGKVLVVESTPEEEVRRILLEQRDEMMGASREPSAFRRINAEFARIWPYFPTMVHDPSTGARVQLIENNPFHYFERYANLTAGRLAYIRHFGQELEKPSLVNQLVDVVQNKRGGSDEVIAVTRALHGLPVERTFWTQPGSAPHQFGIGLRHASSLLKAGALSMTWPQNLFEPLGRILGLAGGPMKRDFWVALGNLYGRADERRAATLSALRGLGAVDHWIRNLSIDPNRPGETSVRMLREIPTVLVRVFWKEQSRLAATIGLAKGERMAAGRGGESDVQDVMSMLGFDRPTAEAMARGDGTPEQYLMIARRAGAYTTNQPMVKAEQSRLEHSRIFRLMFAFTTYGFMGVRWMASNLRTTMPIMRDLWRNPKSKTAWNRARVNVTKISTQTMGLTTAGAGSYFLIALATGGLHGLKLAWNEAKEHPAKFLLDSFLYTMFAGPFGAVMRLTQNQSRNRFEALIRITWPGAIAVEITDMLASSGRYRDREFWGRDGKLMRFTDRFVPINRMFWQGLAVVGIGSDEQKMRTTIMAYWRARQEIAPVVRSQRGEPQVAALKEQFEKDRKFRIQMRLAYDAMLRGDNPQEFINAAFEVDLTKTRGDIARAIRQRRLLTGKFADQSSIEFQALRSRLGDDGILILRQHDQLLEAVAQSINPSGGAVRFRPVPERTLNGLAGRY